MKIKSIISDVIWNIEVSNNSLSNEDINFIENFNPTIYHNDIDCTLWVFDTELPSGRYLENIFFKKSVRCS